MIYYKTDDVIPCSNMRCSGPCLDGVNGGICCSLDEGCSAEDYNLQNCIQCGDTKYDNKCYAICDGQDVGDLDVCSKCLDKENESQCKKAGCSSELCVDKDSDISASICIFKCEFKCLQFQTCGKNENNECQWTTNIGSEQDYADCIKGCKDTNGGNQNGGNQNGPGKVCACQDVYDPICCDNKTYGNECTAKCAGKNVKGPVCYKGECKREL